MPHKKLNKKNAKNKKKNHSFKTDQKESRTSFLGGNIMFCPMTIYICGAYHTQLRADN